MLCTSGWFSLKSMSSFAVNRPNMPGADVRENHRQKVASIPRKAVKMTEGTMPTTAIAEGSESIPLLTISAIMNKATNYACLVKIIHADIT